MKQRFYILLLLALSAGIYVGTASWPALLDSTDAAHAEAAREILQTSNWTILQINGIRYLEKPPLHYWLVALSYKAFGVSTFATRLPLALAVVGLVLMVYVFGRRWFGERAAFYAGLVMCTSPGVFLFTRIMIPEAIYALEFLTMFYFFLRAWQGSLSPRAGYWGAAALLGLATLTRSLVGFFFPVAILGLFLLANGGWRRWRALPVISSAMVFLGVALPWHVSAILSTKGFFWFYFINEQVLRAVGRRYPHDYEAVPLATWLIAHLIWFFPWSFFAPFALKEIPSPKRWRQLGSVGEVKLFLFIWGAFIVLFFTWTKSRLEYYSFGAWPAVALLLGLGLERAEERSERWLPRLQAGLAMAGLLVAGALGAMLWISRGVHSASDITTLLHRNPTSFYRVAMADFFDLTPRAFANLRHQAWTAILIVLPGFLTAWWLRRKGKALPSTVTMAALMAAFFFCANWAFGVFEPRLSSRPLANELRQRMRPGDQLVLYGEYDAASSLAFYTGRRLWIFNGRYNGLEYGSNYPDAPRIFLTDQEFAPLWRGPMRVFLIVPADQTSAALTRLPENGTYLVAQLGGKTVYVNQPLAPNQPPLVELPAREKNHSTARAPSPSAPGVFTPTAALRSHPPHGGSS